MMIVTTVIMMLQAGHGAGWDEDHQDCSWWLAQCGYFRSVNISTLNEMSNISLAIPESHDLYMFGWNESGQLAQPTNLARPAECFSAVEVRIK